MNASILELRGIGKRFGSVAALSGVDLALRAGEIHALCGENGAGKSTLIKVLSGLWPHGSYEGGFLLDGREARFRGPRDAEAAGIAVVHQELSLVPDLSLAENLFLGELPTRGGILDRTELCLRAAKALASFGLDLDPERRMGGLGVGQQQLVEILKALVKGARILLLDEPTAALSDREAERLLGILGELRGRGVTCVYISHRLEEVFALADRITVLRDGRTVWTRERAGADRAAVIRAMVGRELAECFPERTPCPGAVLLAVEDLAVEAEGRRVLEGLQFQVRSGEILGIGGLLGSGRTELLMHLFGAYGRRAGGRVFLEGRELCGESPGERLARGLVLVSEDRKRYGLMLEQSTGFNLSLASLGRLCRFGLLDPEAEAQANRRLASEVALKEASLGMPAGALSGGNQQKVVLGKVLMTEPQVLLLDEPTRGIDVGAKAELYALIQGLASAGKAVVLASSELPELLGMADRILVLSEGRPGGCFLRGAATQELLMEAFLAHRGALRRAG